MAEGKQQKKPTASSTTAQMSDKGTGKGGGDSSEKMSVDGPGSERELPMKPKFTALTAKQLMGNKTEFRKVFVPPHRYTPLKEHWMEIYAPVFEQMRIDIRFNLKVMESEPEIPPQPNTTGPLAQKHPVILSLNH